MCAPLLFFFLLLFLCPPFILEYCQALSFLSNAFALMRVIKDEHTEVTKKKATAGKKASCWPIPFGIFIQCHQSLFHTWDWYCLCCCHSLPCCCCYIAFTHKVWLCLQFPTKCVIIWGIFLFFPRSLMCAQFFCWKNRSPSFLCARFSVFIKICNKANN